MKGDGEVECHRSIKYEHNGDEVSGGHMNCCSKKVQTRKINKKGMQRPLDEEEKTHSVLDVCHVLLCDQACLCPQPAIIITCICYVLCNHTP